MSRLVVDSCVAVKWLVLEEGTSAADELLAKYLRGEIELLAPDTIGAEVGNTLWVRFHRGLATADETQSAWNKFSSLQIAAVPCAPLLPDALRLAIKYGRSVYDCLFLALCLRENCLLATADKRLFNAVGQALPNVWLLTADA